VRCATRGGGVCVYEMNFHLQFIMCDQSVRPCSHFQEATDIYKRLLLENREFMALNV